MKTARCITRTVHLLGAALLLAGCADQPTAPEGVKLLGANAATTGSIIKSSVVTTTTYCRRVDECSTNTRNSVIVEKVGRTGLAMMGISAAGGQSELPPGAVKSMSVSGRTLYVDLAKDPNKLWHVELTRDANARGKISGMRLSLNGKLLLVQNTTWKDVSGAWYHGHTDLSFYVNGHVGVHQEKSFSPTAVLPGNPSDQSVATLSLVNDRNGRVSNVIGFQTDDGGSCPIWFPICQWFQVGTDPESTLASLDATWSGLLNGIGVGIDAAESFLVGVEAGLSATGEPGQDVGTLAEAAWAGLEGLSNPSAENVAVAIAAAAAGGWTKALVDDVVAQLINWLIAALMGLGFM